MSRNCLLTILISELGKTDQLVGTVRDKTPTNNEFGSVFSWKKN